MDISPDQFETQVHRRLMAMLALLENDKASLQSAKPEIAGSGSEVYGHFIDEVRRGLDNLETETTL